MKNPNGYGSVFKLSGKRRRPFTARVTAGWDDFGKQLYKYLGYYASRGEAMIALAEYNKDPYTLDAATVTFAEMYERYTLERFYKIENGEKVLKGSEASMYSYQMAFGLSEKLHKMKFADIRKSHMQGVIDTCGKSHETKKKIRLLYRQLYKLALSNDLATKDYSSFVDVGEDTTISDRSPFTDEEIARIWKDVDLGDFIDTILILIYTGLRPGELVMIENENINIEERYMRGGLKTAAGIDRVIPLNKKITSLIEKRINNEKKYLISEIRGVKHKSRYDAYKRHWDIMMKHFDMKHNPHDCRHTFATLMDNADANKTSVKRIMGHSSDSITEKVYTHKDIEQLIKAIDLI